MRTIDTRKYSTAFKALSDPTRLKILLMLEGKVRSVSEIVNFFNLSQPTISRHLAVLKNAELIRDQRKGQNVFYKLNSNKVKSLLLSTCVCFDCCQDFLKDYFIK